MTTPDASTPATLLHGYCHRCDRWRVLEADAFSVEFAIDIDPVAEAQCPDCGEFGLVKVRLPSPRQRELSLLVLEESPYERWQPLI
jgi:hypothetical protein